MASSELLAIVESLPRARVLVLGDLVLDRYTWGNIERISPEAPVMVLQADRNESRLGGAANVAHSLHALGCAPACLGVTGNDSDGQLLRDLLLDLGSDPELVLTDPSRPTTTKQRFIGRAGAGHPSQVLRVDSEDRSPLGQWLEDEIINHVSREITQHDLLLISDYGKGVCTPRLLQAAIHAARSAEIPVLVDPMRTANWEPYRGATLLKVNRSEAEAAAGAEFTGPRDVLALGRKLCNAYDVQSLAVTLGGSGTAVIGRDGMGAIVPTRPREVYDVTGAGDLVMAVLGVCLAAGVPLQNAAELANVATGIQLERFGAATVSREDLRSELLSHHLAEAIERMGPAQVLSALDRPARNPNQRKTG